MMMMLVKISFFLAGAFLGIVCYEIVRHVVKQKVKHRIRRSIRNFLNRSNMTIDEFKLTPAIVVKRELLNDQAIHEAILTHAQTERISIEETREKVEEYVEEIVPFFNVFSYYQIGYRLAKMVLNLVYNVVLDQASLKKLEHLPKNAAIIYLMNHRSNADYVLTAYMLADRIAVSYAVGEWARVWPLEYLFKSFGSYFIRRGFRDPLYHKVLQKYVQLISRYGVTQGIFLEGGLSRDGRFRPPKIGLLDYILQMKQDAQCDLDIIFIPTAINFDWVLEDRALLNELKRGEKKDASSESLPFMTKLFRLVLLPPKLIGIAFGNALRLLFGRIKRHGYASVSFGEPISLNSYLNQRPAQNLILGDWETRKAELSHLTEMILHKIGEVIPATPVPMTAMAILSCNQDEISREQLELQMVEIRKKLFKRGARIVMGKEFSQEYLIRQHMAEANETRPEFIDFEERLIAGDEAKKTLKLGLEILTRRHVVKKTAQGYHLLDREILTYYANSILHLF